MTELVAAALFSLAGPAGLSIVVKATVTLAGALAAVQVARRSCAAVRHVVLAAALAVLLLLPVASILAPRFDVEVVPAGGVVAEHVLLPAGDAPLQRNGSGTSSTVAARPPVPLSTIAAFAWMVGAACFLLHATAGLWQMHRLRRSSMAWRAGQAAARALAPDAGGVRPVEVLVHDSLLPGPATCGVLRPAILLPADAPQWPDEDLHRALVHELEHVRRRDWLTQCFAQAACALYWFHPLVWMVKRRLVLEAERACDDGVLRRFEATAYAEQLVALARRVAERAAYRGPAMADRDDLRARVTAVLDRDQARGHAGTASVSACAVAAVVLLVALAPIRAVARAGSTLEPAPAPMMTLEPAADSVEPPAAATPSGSAAVPLDAEPRAAASDASRAQDRPGTISGPRFAAATIDPCFGTEGGRRGGGPGPGASPGPETLGLGCRTLAEYIRRAHGYGEKTDVPVEGGPEWVRTDQYQMLLTAEGNPDMSARLGPMLLALLEERFQLRMRRETREVPAYALAVAPGGHKLRGAECRPPRRPPVPGLPPPEGPCATVRVIGINGSNGTLRAEWAELGEVGALLRSLVRRPVVDRTGLDGRFDVYLEYAADTTFLAGSPLAERLANPTAPPVSTAIEEQLGLTLEPTTAPSDVFVVEDAERPSRN